MKIRTTNMAESYHNSLQYKYSRRKPPLGEWIVEFRENTETETVLMLKWLAGEESFQVRKKTRQYFAVTYKMKAARVKLRRFLLSKPSTKSKNCYLLEYIDQMGKCFIVVNHHHNPFYRTIDGMW